MAETADEPIESTKPKISILKASIHCEGCKRKVKKLLSQVPGVVFVDVDTRQQKVTVTGNVDADTLVKKLVKCGKKAEVWPQKAEKSEKNKENETVSLRKTDNREAKSVADITKSPEISTKAEESIKCVEESSDGAAAKSDEKKSEENSAAVPETSPAVEKEAVEKSNVSGAGGTSGKKKKKKGQSGNGATPSGVGTQQHTQPQNQIPTPLPPTNHSQPRGHHPPIYAPPPHQPAYAVSYNTAYPTSSYTTSHYAATPAYSHFYTHVGPVMDPPPLDPYYTRPPPSDRDLNPRQPLDSFEIFSDENPNGCFIM